MFVALLSGAVDKVLQMWYLKLPEMKTEVVVVVALFDFPSKGWSSKPFLAVLKIFPLFLVKVG